MGLCVSRPEDKYSSPACAAKVRSTMHIGSESGCAARNSTEPQLRRIRSCCACIAQEGGHAVAKDTAAAADAGKQHADVHAAIPLPVKASPTQAVPAPAPCMPCGLKIAEAVCPGDELIGNIIDPVNGPAAGLPYKVLHGFLPLPSPGTTATPAIGAVQRKAAWYGTLTAACMRLRCSGALPGSSPTPVRGRAPGHRPRTGPH